MPKKSEHANPFQGRWRITWMEKWGQSFVNEEVEGYFDFKAKGHGSFQFGYVSGKIDYQLSTREGRACIEFTWDGNDEMDQAQGRGWATVEGDEMTGQIFIHLGEASEFKAVKKQRGR